MRRGFTLLETLIYTVLTGLVLTGVYWFFVVVMHYSRVGQANADLTMEAQSGLSLLMTELSDSNAGTILTYTNPAGITFASAWDASNGNQIDQDSTSGLVQWQKWVCYYYDTGTGTLKRNEKALSEGSTTTAPAANTAPNTSSFASLTGARIVAKDMTGFSLPVSYSSGPLQLSMSFARSVFSTNDNQVQITDQVVPRN